MLLGIDVGNSNIVLGVFDGRELRRELADPYPHRCHHRRISGSGGGGCSAPPGSTWR